MNEINDINKLQNDITQRMEGAVKVLLSEYSGLRTGRAATTLLSPILVPAYGSEMPMDQIGTISVPESRMLTVQVWDKQLISSVLKAILESGLGLNPSAEGQLIRIPIPALTEERRHELSKVASKYTEDARIAVRNIRRHAMDDLKNAEKKSELSQDQHHEYSEIVQELTNKYIRKIDDALKIKEQDIMQV